MFEDNALYAAAFEDDCCAARVCKFVTANPYLDRDSVELTAWVDGFASVNTAELIPLQRARIFHEGETAARDGAPPYLCPYRLEENPKRMEFG